MFIEYRCWCTSYWCCSMLLKMITFDQVSFPFCKNLHSPEFVWHEDEWSDTKGFIHILSHSQEYFFLLAGLRSSEIINVIIIMSATLLLMEILHCSNQRRVDFRLLWLSLGSRRWSLSSSVATTDLYSLSVTAPTSCLIYLIFTVTRQNGQQQNLQRQAMTSRY